MTVGSVANTNVYSPATLKASAAASAKTNEGSQTAEQTRSVKTGESSVSISEEAKRMQAADTGKQKTEADDGTQTTQLAESFAYGALGMDHPDEVKQNTDDFYTAGQVLSALGTVATVLLAIA
ncbi:hypothetical protein BIT28_08260 [Photobacterium proteolyticum]|uniref:Uncharacterized protein n=1 Tax=Photobacterium proteolyticum TaxID=1903952 RepID=A0A1Q9GGF6_9GAMM|nr:hypothetical protein [Photobacterium proteolyticum]OLQ73560.1 hypothetical protein BIT28_08260 [Photobacterium proteolyticum]